MAEGEPNVAPLTSTTLLAAALIGCPATLSDFWRRQCYNDPEEQAAWDGIQKQLEDARKVEADQERAQVDSANKENVSSETGATALTERELRLQSIMGVDSQLLVQWERALEVRSNRLSGALKMMEETRAEVEAQTAEAVKGLDVASMKFEDRKSQLQMRLDTAHRTLASLQETVGENGDLVEMLQHKFEDNSAKLVQARSDLDALREQSTAATWLCTAALQMASQSSEALKELEAYKKRMVSHLALLDVRRRAAHNQLQELKGNLRVFCRIRPPVGREAEHPEEVLGHMISEDGTSLLILPSSLPSPSLDATSQHFATSPVAASMTFDFDHIFSTSVTQEEVFREVRSLIQSALDGFNVSLFAYGQTGSGKTYTMLGPPNTPALIHGTGGATGSSSARSLTSRALPAVAGVIPRAVKLIFDTVEDLQTLKGWRYQLSLCAFEIYNESIRDLLRGYNPPGAGAGDQTARSTAPCDVKLDAKGNCVVTNATQLPVLTSEEIFAALAVADNNRSVASTGCNEASSRSHSVLQIHIMGTHAREAKTVNSVLSLVDLAGSERLEKSHATGDRLRETQHINKSLSALCNVICSIAARKPHIPFRDSKLTLLLRESLGGQAKTLMFVNIAPSLSCRHETVNSLRFAAKANTCRLGYEPPTG